MRFVAWGGDLIATFAEAGEPVFGPVVGIFEGYWGCGPVVWVEGTVGGAAGEVASGLLMSERVFRV